MPEHEELEGRWSQSVEELRHCSGIPHLWLQAFMPSVPCLMTKFVMPGSILNTCYLIRAIGEKTVNYTVHTLGNWRLSKGSYMSALPLNSHLFPWATKGLELTEKLEVIMFPKIAGLLNPVPANALS